MQGEVETRRPGLESSTGEERPAFDDEGLLAVGVDPLEVGRLRERWEQFELEKLELAYSSAREGRSRELYVPRGPLGILIK